jgi:hypothetical protein
VQLGEWLKDSRVRGNATQKGYGEPKQAGGGSPTPRPSDGSAKAKPNGNFDPHPGGEWKAHVQPSQHSKAAGENSEHTQSVADGYAASPFCLGALPLVHDEVHDSPERQEDEHHGDDVNELVNVVTHVQQKVLLVLDNLLICEQLHQSTLSLRARPVLVESEIINGVGFADPT